MDQHQRTTSTYMPASCGSIRNAMPTPDELAAFRARTWPDGEEVRDDVLALAWVLLDEINILRAEHGLAARTKTQAVTAMRSRMEDLTVE